MKEKVKRILDLVRGGKLTLDDAAPLLAALNTKLALQTTDRELIDSLLAREDLDTTQIAEHLLLLRGVKDAPPPPPPPPRPPQVNDPDWSWDVWSRNAQDRARRAEARAERAESRTRRREASRRGRGLDGMLDNIADGVERVVETALEGVEKNMTGISYGYEKRPNPSNRVLKIRVESSSGDEYSANIPISLAAHLDKLIPPYGVRALESAGFSLAALQLMIEADPPSGDLINAEDSAGNEVSISIR